MHAPVQEIQEIQEMQERPCGATDESVVQSGVSRKDQASKPLNFRGASAPMSSWKEVAIKKSRPGAALFWDWGVAHSCWAVRLTDTPSVKPSSSVRPSRAVSGSVSSTVPDPLLASSTVVTFTIRSEPVSPGTFTFRV